MGANFVQYLVGQLAPANQTLDRTPARACASKLAPTQTGDGQRPPVMPLKSLTKEKMKFLDSIIELIRLFMPKFYNKITWTVVIGGMALTSTSMIEKILDVLLEKNLNIKLTDEKDGIIGVALVVIGLTYHLLAQKINGLSSRLCG
ncbi:MAG: hypothetical protein J7K75_02640 [Desulfuromonas sp.]|nr:hypothetical protein [Desulfuromonas sp.]